MTLPTRRPIWSRPRSGRRSRARLALLGWLTLPAAEHICTGDLLRGEDVADVLGALVDKSLLVLDRRRSTTRYTMLETLREFACERLAARQDAPDATLAHAHYFTALARQAEPRIRGPDEAEWVALLDADVANFGIPATGKEIRVSGIAIWTIRNGRIVEHWHETDQAGLLRQLGVLPPGAEYRRRRGSNDLVCAKFQAHVR